jgi:hypothetical protein
VDIKYSGGDLDGGLVGVYHLDSLTGSWRGIRMEIDRDLEGNLDGDLLGLVDGDLDGQLLGDFDGLFDRLLEGDLDELFSGHLDSSNRGKTVVVI